jgi:hypothetical protein
MLKNTQQLKVKLDRSLGRASLGQMKSEPRAGVIKVVAQESIVGLVHARAKKNALRVTYGLRSKF